MKTNANDPIDWKWFRPLESNESGFVKGNLPGLTKLEHFSSMAMQGMLSACDIMSGLPSYEGLAKDSVQYAQALINELNKVEPKVGDTWTCESDEYVSFTKGNPYPISEIVGNKVILITDRGTNGGFTKSELLQDFKFHSNPETMTTEETTLNTKEEEATLNNEPISERKAASFRFYDQLPPELARQAKENFQEYYVDAIPKTLSYAIRLGWNFSEGIHGDDESWNKVIDNAENGKYNLSEASSVVVDKVKHERQFMGVNRESFFDLYSKLDDNGKRVMRETYRNVEFPKVKRYWDTIHAPFTYSHGILTCLDDVTPEIVGNEIRFVKN